MGQKERDPGRPRQSGCAYVAVDAVPEQLFARSPAESTLFVRILRLKDLFCERIYLVTSFGRQPTGYVCGYFVGGYVGCETGVCGWDEVGGEAVDAMGGGVKNGGPGRRR